MRTSKCFRTISTMVVFLMIAMVTGACAQSSRTAGKQAESGAKPSDPSKVVLKVGNVQVTESDIDAMLGSLTPQQQQLVERGGRHAVGEQYAAMLVLSQAAVNKHLDSSPEFKKEMQQHRDRLLAQLEYKDLLGKATVSPAEISQFYSAHQPEFEQAKVHEIAVLKKTSTGSTGLAPAVAQAKAEAIRKALASGAPITKVAHDFDSPNEVIVRTDAQTVPNSPTLPEFAKAAFQLQPGALSSINDRPDALIFFQLVSRSQVSLKDASSEIENAIRQQKVEAAMNDLKKQTPVWMDPAFFGDASTAPPPAHP